MGWPEDQRETAWRSGGAWRLDPAWRPAASVDGACAAGTAYRWAARFGRPGAAGPGRWRSARI